MTLTFKEVATAVWRAAQRTAGVAGTLARRFLAAVIEWSGPVANSVRGQVNTTEVARVLQKAAITSGTAFGVDKLLEAVGHNPEVRAQIIVPILIGVFIGSLEYLARLGHGAPAPPGDTLPPPPAAPPGPPPPPPPPAAASQ